MFSSVLSIMIEEIFEDDEQEETVSSAKIEDFVEITVPRFDSKQFKCHFRMQPQTFEILLLQIHGANDRLHQVFRGKPELSVEKQTLLTIWCLANLECFR